MLSSKRFIYRFVRFSRRINIYLSASWISILVLLIIASMLMFLEQGGTVLIDLLHNTQRSFGIGALNILSLLLYIFTFSLIISHYPVYLFLKKRNLWTPVNKRNFEWEMKSPQLFGIIGFITFKIKDKVAKTRRLYLADRSSYISLSETSYFRHNLGIITFSLTVYILVFTYKRFVNIDVFFDPFLWAIIHWVIFSAIYLFLRSMRKIKRLSFVFKVRLISSYVSILLGIILIVLSHTKGWDALTYLFLVLLLCAGTLNYCSLRISRSISFDELQDCEDPDIAEKVKRIRQFLPLSLLDNHLYFIRAISLVGVYSLVVILISHIAPMETFNPLIVLMAYLNVFYGVIIVSVKHHIYYTSNKAYEAIMSSKMRRILTSFARFGVVALFVFIFLPARDNNLHELPLQQRDSDKSKVLSLEDYMVSFKERNDSKENIYFISSYGGGLKANYWNLLVLDQLDSLGILDQTISMSGVSGGALGQSFYELIRDKLSKQKIINDLGNSNFVTLDLTYLFGFDLLRSKIDVLTSYSDRAKRAMSIYAKEVEEINSVKIPFRELWKEKWSSGSNSKSLPILIENTSGTHHKRGIVCSVEIDKFQDAFPYTDDLLTLNQGNKTLSYMHAVSLANRFPIFSPAARIHGVGHFVDGGYFDNSGLLSNIDLYKYLLNEDTTDWFKGKKIHFIQVTNDPGEYTWIATRKLKKTHLEEERVSELGMILNTSSSLLMLPRHVLTQFEDNLMREDTAISLHFVSLPYRVDRNRVNSVYGLQSYQSDEIDTFIKNNNDQIDQMLLGCDFKQSGKVTKENLRWKYIQPPLARALGEQVKNYMDVMSKQPSVYKNLVNE